MRRGQYCRSRDGGLGICCSYPVKAVTIPQAGGLVLLASGRPRLQAVAVAVAYSVRFGKWWADFLHFSCHRETNLGNWCDRSSQPHRAGQSQIDELYAVRVAINRKREARCTIKYACSSSATLSYS